MQHEDKIKGNKNIIIKDTSNSKISIGNSIKYESKKNKTLIIIISIVIPVIALITKILIG